MNKKHGITGPLSVRTSSALDHKKSQLLESFLRTSNFFESLSELQARERVIGILHFAAEKILKSRVHTFGSYRLGVHQRFADIDALVISPSSYTHVDFFSKFFDYIQTLESVSDLQKVEDAYVPLIKLTINNIAVDIVFARTGLLNVGGLNLLDDTLLKDMDDKSIISINGSRVTDMLIELVPDRGVFHGALRCIKYWAKRRGIYGNSYGYFGGVAYAISVARICQFYPNASAYQVVYKYFEVYSNWEWPTPVALCVTVNRNYGLRVWDPKINYTDKFHKMPVITPAYPAMCSTHNIGSSTMSLMVEEVKRGFRILKDGKEFDSVYTNNADVIKEDCIKNDNNVTDANNSNIVNINLASNKEINIKNGNVDLNNAENNKNNCRNKNVANELHSEVKGVDDDNNKTNGSNINGDNIKICVNIGNNGLEDSEVQNKIHFLKHNNSGTIEESNKNEYNSGNVTIGSVPKDELKLRSDDLNKNSHSTESNTKIVDEIKKSSDKLPQSSFEALFISLLKSLTQQSPFFLTYKSYLKVTIPNIPAWVGYIESKIRTLCNKIETAEQYSTAVAIQAFPYPSSFKFRASNQKTKLMPKENKQMSEIRNHEDGCNEVYDNLAESRQEIHTVNFFIGLKYESKIKVNIDKPVKEFKEQVMEWVGKQEIDILLYKKKEVGHFLRDYYKQKETVEGMGVENIKRVKV